MPVASSTFRLLIKCIHRPLVFHWPLVSTQERCVLYRDEGVERRIVASRLSVHTRADNFTRAPRRIVFLSWALYFFVVIVFRLVRLDTSLRLL